MNLDQRDLNMLKFIGDSLFGGYSYSRFSVLSQENKKRLDRLIATGLVLRDRDRVRLTVDALTVLTANGLTTSAHESQQGVNREKLYDAHKSWQRGDALCAHCGRKLMHYISTPQGSVGRCCQHRVTDETPADAREPICWPAGFEPSH